MLFLFLMVIHYVIGYTLPQIENGIELLERRSSTHYQALLIAWIGTSSEDIPVNFKKVFTISQYVDGPSIKVSYIFGKNYTNSIITKHIDVCDNNNESRLLLFDNFNDPYDYYEIPKELYEEDNIHLFKTFLDNRHEITINFTFTADVSLAFLWVHARGNYKLHQLGDNGDKLIINKHNFNIQRTKAGHMFALINDTFSEYNCITETLNAIVAIYIVPAAELKIPQQSITVDLWKESIHCRKTVNCKELILSYWKSQRQSSIPLQSWTVPAVNKKSEKGLFFVEKLPASTFNSLREEYLSQRRSIIDSKESIISTVFNQLEVDTHFYPISNALIAVIEDIVRKMVSKRWEIPFYNLEITSLYGIREYRKNAIIGWHTDPSLTQPITAIIHVGHGLVEEIEKNTCSWELQIASICIESNHVNTTTVVLKEGEILLLESAKLAHARTVKLKDDYYGNLFVHLREKTWSLPIDD